MSKGFHNFGKTSYFKKKQKQVYKELNREKEGDRITPDSEYSIKF